jgi:Cu/Ag efflux pump CusA
VRPAYERASRLTLHRPLVAIGAAVVLVAVGAVTLIRLDVKALPSFEERQLLVDLDAAPGTSLPEMRRITARAAEELRGVDGVADVGAFVGRAITSDQVVSVNSAELWARIEDSADYDATRARIEEVLDGYPGLGTDVVSYADSRLRQVLGSGEAPIDVRLYGEDQTVLREKAEEVRAKLEGVSGLTDLRVVAPPVEPTVRVEVDLEAAARFGVKPGDVRRAAATLLSGIEVGSLFEDQKVFQVIVQGSRDRQRSLSDIDGLLIDTATGGHARLGDVADVQVAATPSVIKREASAQIVDITAGVDGRSRGAVVDDVNRALEGVSLPLGFHAELKSGYAEQKAAESRVLKVVVAAAAGLLLLLQAAFGNWRLAAAVLVLLPLSVVGGLVAVAIGGDTLQLGSIVGLFAVGGLAIRGAALTIDRARELEGNATNGSARPAIVTAAAERVTPTIVTAVVAAASSVPLLFLANRPGGELVVPLVVVLLGGLVSVAVVNLFLLPPLYLWLRPAIRQGEQEVLDLIHEEQKTSRDPREVVHV